jgi:hypothetical protein
MDIHLSQAVVPVTVLANTTSDTTDVPFHPSYSGTIVFQNTFNGQLSASDYPKVTVSDLRRGEFSTTYAYLIHYSSTWLCSWSILF